MKGIDGARSDLTASDAFFEGEHSGSCTAMKRPLTELSLAGREGSLASSAETASGYLGFGGRESKARGRRFGGVQLPQAFAVRSCDGVSACSVGLLAVGRGGATQASPCQAGQQGGAIERRRLASRRCGCRKERPGGGADKASQAASALDCLSDSGAAVRYGHFKTRGYEQCGGFSLTVRVDNDPGRGCRRGPRPAVASDNRGRRMVRPASKAQGYV